MMKCEHCGCEYNTVSVEISEQLYNRLELIERRLSDRDHQDMNEFADFAIGEFIDICESIDEFEYDEFKYFLFHRIGVYIDKLRPEWSERYAIICK